MIERSSDRNLSPLLGAALLGAAAILFFHPGALDMDRLKANLLLTASVPLLLIFAGPRRLAAALAERGGSLLVAAGALVFFLALNFTPGSTGHPDGLRLLAFLAVLMLVLVVMRNHAWARPFLVPGILLATGLIVAAYALLQTAGIDPFYVENPRREAVSTLGNSTETAEVLALLLPWALAFLLAPGRGAFLFGALSFALIAAGLWVTGGRAGALAALAGATVLLVLRLCKTTGDGAPSLGFSLAGAAVALVLGLAAGGILTASRGPAFKNIESDASILSPDYPTNKVRLAVWDGTLEMIGDRPLLGAGAGRFRYDFPPYRDPEEARIPGLRGARTEVHDPHNEFLWAAAEGGVPAGLALAAFLGLIFLRFMALAGNALDYRHRLAACAGAGTAAAFAVDALFASPLHDPATAVILFLTAGLAAAGTPDPGEDGRRIPRGLIALPAAAGLAILGILLGGPGLLADLGAARIAVGDTLGPEELRAFQAAADRDPSNLDLANFVGQTAGMRLAGTSADRDGRYTDDAIRRLCHVLDRHPWHSGALRTLARLRAFRGELPAAKHLIARYLRTGVGEGDPAKLLAGFLREAGNEREALKIEYGTPGADPAPLLNEAEAAEQAGNPTRAAMLCDIYLTFRPLDGDALFILGRSLKAAFDGGHRDAFRRMHMAYALDWMEQGDWMQAQVSARLVRRYGEGTGEADVLDALILAEREDERFEGPRRIPVNRPFLERIAALNEAGRLPEGVTPWIRKALRKRP